MGEILGYQIPGVTAMIAQWEERLSECMDQLSIPYDSRAPKRMARYYEMLCDWNQRINLIGDTDFDTALDRHFADSLAPLAVDGLFEQGASLIDVGSGAGFPGLPLAIARPDLHVTLLDSLTKRLTFLSAVVEELGLENVRLVHARAEDGGQAAAHRERYDVAVARAVAALPVLCELLLPFVRVGGQMICYKGPAAQEEQLAGSEAARLLGGASMKALPISLPTQPDWRHCLLISKKIQKTARQYPRKAGTPAKLPLSGFDKERA